MSQKELLEALQNLDPNDDDDWTADGLPRVDRVQAIMGKDTGLKRSDITELAPKLTRETFAELAKGAEAVEDEQKAQEDPPVAQEAEPEPSEAEDADKSKKPKAKDNDRFMPLSPGLVSDAFPLPTRKSEDELKVLQDMVGILDNVRSQVDAHRDKVLARINVLTVAGDSAATALENQQGIMAYVKNQNEQRAQRAERRDAILSTGILAVDMDSKSRLDQALGNRKRQVRS